MKNKKGISPIIATVLLIVIAIALFLLIFLWIRSFQGERIEKFGAPIENACENVQLQLNVFGSDLQVENIGNVPVYKLQLFALEQGSTTNLGEVEVDVGAGGTTTTFIPGSCSDQLKVIPILLGTAEGGAQKEFVCEDKPIIVSC